MNILITGASGFIGSNLLKSINNNMDLSSHKIILLTSRQIDGYVCIEHKNYTFKKESFLNKGINNIDIVIHLGAFIPKSNKQSNYIDESYSNIKNTIYLLKHLPNVPAKFIFASTIDVYKNTNNKIDEKTSTDPISLYGWSKLMCEKIIEQYGVQNNVIVQVLRIGHIYGEGEEIYQKLIPVSIKKILNGTSPQIFSNKDDLRAYLHVDDCCKCIIKSTNLKKYNGPINLVSEKTISIHNLVKMLIEISGKRLDISIKESNHLKRNLIFSNKKMKEYLCEEKIKLDDGLDREIKYLKEKYNGDFNE